MWNREKVEEKIKNLNISSWNIHEYKFIINEKPEAYARERKGRGKHFYNPKADIIDRYKKTMKSQLTKDHKKEIEDVYTEVLKELRTAYIELYCDFYIPIPKGDSIITAAKKEMKEILPAQRPDVDNYEKLLLDALHDVVYEDDSRVIKIVANKYFSMDPRTEVKVILKEKKV